MVDNLTLKDFEMGKTLYAHMAEILRGSVFERLGRVAIANGILTRAFMGHFFSSQEFLRRCRPYGRDVSRMAIGYRVSVFGFRVWAATD